MLNAVAACLPLWEIYEDLSCIVYVAVNRITRDIYVGATEKGLHARRYQHIWRAKNGIGNKLGRAIRKYGDENFEFLIVERCENFFHALEREEEFIATLYPEYNLTRGGGGIKGYKFSPEAIAKCVDGRRGKTGHPCPQWLKEKNAALRRAERGKKVLSEQNKAELRLNAAKANASRRRPVICLNDGIVYRSVTEAGRAYGLTSGQVSRYCKGIGQSKRGLKFRYAERLP